MLSSAALKRISSGPSKAARAFDYVVLGGGAGGCAAAAALTKRFPGASVALIEAGSLVNSVFVDSPMLTPFITGGRYKFLRAYDWAYRTLPVPNCDDRSLVIHSGRGLGGSTLLTPPLYLRGHPDDYSSWGSNWTYKQVLRIFCEMERNSRGESDVHGASGGLCVSDVSPALASNKFNATFLDSCYSAQLLRKDDFCEESGTEGCGEYQTTVVRGRRRTAFDTHVAPLLEAERPPELHVMSNSFVHSLQFDPRQPTRVCSVRVGASNTSGPLDEFTVNREVIVALGAIETPALLQRSGIGNEARLQTINVERVVVPNAEVGRNLSVPLTVTVGVKFDFHAERSRSFSFFNSKYLWRQWAEYKRDHTGIFTGLIETGGFLRSDTNCTKPDVQLHFVAAPMYDNGSARTVHDGCCVLATGLYPLSTGDVSITAATADKPPVIHLPLLRAPEEMEVLEEAQNWGSLLLDPAVGLCSPRSSTFRGPAHPFIHHAPSPYSPGIDVRTRERRRRHIARTATVTGSPTGTCALGSVVDWDLRVKGCDNLRVFDASIIPSPMGTTDVSTVVQMIAVRGVDFMRI